HQRGQIEVEPAGQPTGVDAQGRTAVGADAEPLVAGGAVFVQGQLDLADGGFECRAAIELPLAIDPQAGERRIDIAATTGARPAVGAGAVPLVAGGAGFVQGQLDLADGGFECRAAIELPLAIDPQAGERRIDVAATIGARPDPVEPGQRPGERQAGSAAGTGE